MTVSTHTRTIDGHRIRYEQAYVDTGTGPYITWEPSTWTVYVDDVPVADQEEAEQWRQRLRENEDVSPQG